ncbi:hypothetical protein KKI23_03515 [Patescibacteria group bacterium]|nr:hypothetical protein [Patescibacteria group bacterium]
MTGVIVIKVREVLQIAIATMLVTGWFVVQPQVRQGDSLLLAFFIGLFHLALCALLACAYRHYRSTRS